MNLKKITTTEQVDEKIKKLQSKIIELKYHKMKLCKHLSMSGNGLSMKCNHCGYIKVSPVYY